MMVLMLAPVLMFPPKIADKPPPVATVSVERLEGTDALPILPQLPLSFRLSKIVLAFHEIFIADHPACSHRREVAPCIATLEEFRRTISAKRCIQHVAITERVIYPTEIRSVSSQITFVFHIAAVGITQVPGTRSPSLE
jgi:hypothetical protein